MIKNKKFNNKLGDRILARVLKPVIMTVGVRMAMKRANVSRKIAKREMLKAYNRKIR